MDSKSIETTESCLARRVTHTKHWAGVESACVCCLCRMRCHLSVVAHGDPVADGSPASGFGRARKRRRLQLAKGVP